MELQCTAYASDQAVNISLGVEIVENQLHLRPGLQTFLNSVQSQMEIIASSHSSGLLKKSALYQIKNHGKKLRSQLIYHLSSSLGAEKFENILLWAVSNELMHEASLIHDDIQDQDPTRRGQDSLWKIYGQAQAINTGDYLLMLSMKPLIEMERIDLLKTHTQASYKLAQGQSEEIEQKASLDASNNFYINCIEKKTAALFSSLAQGVTQILDLGDKSKMEVSEIFLKLGCIFQMQDDILDLYGNKGRKACGCDIKEGKISFLIHTHLMHNPEDKEYLDALLSKDYSQTTQEEVEGLKSLFEQKNTLQYCLENLKSEIKALKGYSSRTETFKDNSDLLDSYVDTITKPISHLLV